MDFVKLASICNLKQWSTIAKTDLSDSGYPVWGANGIIGYSNKYNHTERTIMICCRGATCGSINISDGKCYINGNAMCLDNLSKEFNLDFIAYYLKNYDFKKTITGVAQPQITKVSLDIVEVPKLPIERQQEIAQNLKKLELCLTKTRIKLKKYDDLVKSQFIEMFETLECPVKTIGDVCLLKSGKTFDSSLEQENGEFMYAKVSDMNLYGNEKFMLTSNKFVNKQTAGKNLISIGAVIFPKRGGAIGTNKKRVVIKEMCVDLNIMAVIPQEEITTEYLYQYFLNIDMESLSNGANVPQINNKDIAPLKIKVPPKELQNKFAEIVKHIDKLKFRETITKLKNLCYNIFNIIQSKKLK